MTEVTEGEYKAIITKENIFIQHLLIDKVLNIDKNSGSITEGNIDILQKNNKKTNIYKPLALLGIIHIENIEFLIFVKSAYFIGKIQESDIFRVKEVELIPIISDEKLDFIGNDVKNLIEGIKNLYTLGFFYSFDYDLTNSLQNQSKMKDLDILTSANKKFFWNFCLYKNFYSTNSCNIINDNINNFNAKNNINIYNNEIINQNENNNKNLIYTLKVNKIWIVVCIYGYVGVINTKLNNNHLQKEKEKEKIQIYLISRRSIFHSGTRYLTRGVDDNGHVANHVETEQILEIKENLFSFLQLRGSVPIFFEQPGIKANTFITRNSTMTSPAFKKHIQEIKEDFNFVYLINLMNVNKPNEQIITENYELQIKNNQIKDLKYDFWDFQNKCKYDNYEELDNFVTRLEGVFKVFKFYHEKNKNTLKQQDGIIRTNCLDCLDRTNVIQARIAWKVLEFLVSFYLIEIIIIIISTFISFIINYLLLLLN
jgi:hypothetical protein